MYYNYNISESTLAPFFPVMLRSGLWGGQYIALRTPASSLFNGIDPFSLSENVILSLIRFKQLIKQHKNKNKDANNIRTWYNNA